MSASIQTRVHVVHLFMSLETYFIHSTFIELAKLSKYLNIYRIPGLVRAWKRPEWVKTSHATDVSCVIFFINIHYYTIYGQNIDGCKKAVRS